VGERRKRERVVTIFLVLAYVVKGSGGGGTQGGQGGWAACQGPSWATPWEGTLGQAEPGPLVLYSISLAL
jgi:hypothetical protein